MTGQPHPVSSARRVAHLSSSSSAGGRWGVMPTCLLHQQSSAVVWNQVLLQMVCISQLVLHNKLPSSR